MDLPTTYLGWLNLAAYAWAFLAYATAAAAGIRALNRVYDGPPAAPFCLIVDATRWVFGRQMSRAAWRPRDFLAFGVFCSVAACLIAALASVDFALESHWRKLGRAMSLQQVADDILIGSSLILIHCGVALRFKREAP